jgi:hypothetical protein
MKILITLIALAACGPDKTKEQQDAERCRNICPKIDMAAMGIALFHGEEHATCICEPFSHLSKDNPPTNDFFTCHEL